MREVLDALQAQQRQLSVMVDPLDDEGLGRPSRCDGWSIADVLLHLAQTNEFAAASARGDLAAIAERGPEVGPATDVDEWAGAVVDAERSADPGAVRTRWHRSAEEQVVALAACDSGARLQWVAGDLAARTLATTRLAETWIHSGDIAAGLGVELPPTDRLWHISRLAHRTLPYAFTRAQQALAGPVAFELRSPSGELWRFGEGDAPTVVRGEALELCEVAGQRRDASASSLRAEGPDGGAVLALVRTFA